ncbi:MAG: hypothetical protein AAGF12_38150 [Myxococcota bacterium]
MSGFGQPPGGGGFGQPPGGQPPAGGGFGMPPGGQPPAPGGFGQPQGYGQPGGGGFAPQGPGAPQDYKTLGIFMLISGIMNVLVSISFVLVFIWICVGVVWILPLAGGIFEIVVAAQIMGGKPQPNAKTAAIMGLISGVICFNVIGIVLEILALVQLGKPEVAQYAQGR